MRGHSCLPNSSSDSPIEFQQRRGLRVGQQVLARASTSRRCRSVCRWSAGIGFGDDRDTLKSGKWMGQGTFRHGAMGWKLARLRRGAKRAALVSLTPKKRLHNPDELGTRRRLSVASRSTGGIDSDGRPGKCDQ